MSENGGGSGCALALGGLLFMSVVAVLLVVLAVGVGAAGFVMWRSSPPIEVEEEIPLAFATPGEGEIEAVEPEVAPEPASEGEAEPSEPSSEPRPAPAPGPAPRPAPQAGPAPAPAPAAPAPTPKPAPSGGVSNDILAATLNNSVGVKRCFVPLFKAGTMPSRVDVRLTIEPNGSVSAARVERPTDLGNDFNACIAGAIFATSYPPFNGSAQTLIFPFQAG